MKARHTRRSQRIARVLLFAVGFMLFSATAAYAFFSSTSDGTGLAKAGQVNGGNSPSGTVSGRDVALTWTAATLSNGHAVSGYTVTKTNVAPGTLSTTVNGSCAGTPSASPCTDKGVAENGTSATTWKYTVTPVYDQWKGNPSSTSATVTVPGPTLSLATTSFTTSGGTTTATVSNYFDTEIAHFCVTSDATSCPAADTAGTATIPSSGGAKTQSITIPSGLSTGSHTLYAEGTSGSNPTGVTITVTSPAIQFLGAGAASTGTGNSAASVAFPSPTAGLKATDLLLLLIARSHNNSVTCPTGWNMNATMAVTAGGAHAYEEVCYKKWTSGSAVTVTFTGTNTTSWTTEVVGFRNVTSTNPFDLTSVTSASGAGAATFTPTGFKTAHTLDVAVSVVMENAATTTKPTFTLQNPQSFATGSSAGTASGTSEALNYAYKTIAAKTTTVAFPTWHTTQTSSGSHWIGVSIALRDDPPGATSTVPVAPPALVQSASADATTAVATFALTLPAPVTPGDALTLALALQPGGPSVSVVSGGGITWQMATGTGTSSPIGDAEVWYGLASVGGSRTVTINLSGPAVVTMANLSEWSGVRTLDTSTTATGSGTTVGAGSLSPSQSGDLIVSVAVVTGNSTGATTVNAPFAAIGGLGTSWGYYGANVQATGVTSPTTISWSDGGAGSWAAASAALSP